MKYPDIIAVLLRIIWVSVETKQMANDAPKVMWCSNHDRIDLYLFLAVINGLV